MYKHIIALILVFSLITCSAFAEWNKDLPDQETGTGYIKHYKPAEDKAKYLCEKAGAVTEREKFEAVTNWLNKVISYDYIRQMHWKELKGPDIKRCFDKNTGICVDIACLACCMLRSVGIEANAVLGWATHIKTMYTDYNGVRVYNLGTSWHEWCEVYIDGKKIIYDQIIENKNRNLVKIVHSATYKVSHVIK